MKKIIIVLLLVVSLVFVFCGCNSEDGNATEPSVNSSETAGGSIEPVEKETIDWETPIDVDDSFVEELSSSDETGPLTTVDSTDPTDPTDPTDSTDPTEAPKTTYPSVDGSVEETEPTVTETKKSNGSSGAIELPMIPG